MKYVIRFYLLLITYHSYADMPGNKPRPDYNVKILGMNQYKDYTFYTQSNGDVETLKDSASLIVAGGYGAPQCVRVWGVNHKTEQHTDTLFFCSGESDLNKSVHITLKNNHLSVPVDTSIVKEKYSMPFGSVNGNPDTQSVKNKNIMYFISGLSFFILIVLVFFIWNKNKKSKIQKTV